VYLGEYRIGDYVDIVAVGHRFSSGAVYAVDPCTYTVYKNGSAVQIVTATAMTNFDSETGLYFDSILLSSELGYSNNSRYVVLIKGTVDSVAAIEWRSFRIMETLGDINGRLKCLQTQIINALQPQNMFKGVVTDAAGINVGADSTEILTRLPDATAGAAGGIFIAGENAATSITTALTANIIGNIIGTVDVVTTLTNKTGFALAAGPSGIAYITLAERIYKMLNDKMDITEADGTVSLKEIGGATEVAAGDVESAAGITTRLELTWV
jgi:hypothetical protein